MHRTVLLVMHVALATYSGPRINIFTYNAHMQLPDMNLLGPLTRLRALSLAMNNVGPMPMGSMLGEPSPDAFQVCFNLNL